MFSAVDKTDGIKSLRHFTFVKQNALFKNKFTEKENVEHRTKKTSP
jgi:hypothetical protein